MTWMRLPRLLASVLVLAWLLVTGSAVSASSIAAPVPADDPFHRELRLAAALGLLSGPLYGQAPMSRSEAFRLLRGPADRRPDASRGVTDDVAYRMARVRAALGGRDAWQQGRYLPAVRVTPDERLWITGSTVRRGAQATRYLDHGYAWRQGMTLENQASLGADLRHVALDVSGRFRADGDGAEFRFTRLNARTGFGNLRLIVGREPLQWGPEVHGGLLISRNARPLDQIRLESEKPFTLFNVRALTFTGSFFVGRLDDPDRKDFANPNLTGMRVTWQPARWFAFGATRTVMFGGEGNAYRWSVGSFLDMLLGRNENRNTSEGIVNDTDQKASIDGSIYLWPVLQHAPVVQGGRIYAQYGGEDSPQHGNPLPSAPGRVWGLELVGEGILGRVEWSDVVDDHNLWYWHKIYTDGYTYRGVVLGHPMGQDSDALSVDLEIPLGRWGLLMPSWQRQRHGFSAYLNTPPDASFPPIPHAEPQRFGLAVEAAMGRLPGSLWVEGGEWRESGDLERNGPTEDWGISVGWRR